MEATPERQVGPFSNSNAAGVGHCGSAESAVQVRLEPVRADATAVAQNRCGERRRKLLADTSQLRREPVG
jgi:hypothetical protein